MGRNHIRPEVHHKSHWIDIQIRIPLRGRLPFSGLVILSVIAAKI